jgi:N-acetyl-gamma-glutamylphosphate reductase
MSKLFVIFGATGQQGGALVDYLLQHPEFSKAFHLRGVTRNASSSAAEELKKMGVEIVEVCLLRTKLLASCSNASKQADLDKPETLPAAVTGSYGVFAVTDCKSSL